MTAEPAPGEGATASALAAIGRPTPRDVVAGLVTGLFSIPEGMAYASIGGFNPVAGLYSGIVPTLVGSAFARTVLMVTTLTSAIALTSQSVLAGAGLDPANPGNLAALAVVVGAWMAVLGLLRVGWIMDFVSTAVMTGFTTGIALQIVAGVLGDATGYDPTSHNTIAKVVESVLHLGAWDPTIVAVSVATIVAWAALRLVKPLASLATLIALVVVTVAVQAVAVAVPTVGGIAAIPNALPAPVLPDVAALPALLPGGLAVALVALAQAAGIAAAVPNPDRSRPNASADFLAQGVANLAGGLFQALPTGGSLSRTGVAVSAGAQTRWAGIFAGAWLALVALLFGSVAEAIPMAVIGGLIIVIGAELLEGRRHDIVLVLRTAPVSAAAMIVTFLATTQLPLQQAIFLGAVLSIVLYAWQAARIARLVALVPSPGGDWQVVPVPAACPSGEVTVLHYDGVGLFAEVPRFHERLPDISRTRDAVLVLSLRTLPDVPSATMVKELERVAATLAANGSRLVLAGVDPAMTATFERSGLTAALGEDGIVPSGDRVFGAIDSAAEAGRRWVAATRSEAGPTTGR